MPLTRHLYELDEVVSALQLCLRNGWPRALFWLWELVVSEEQELATQTLTDAWLQWGGGHDPQILELGADASWMERGSRIQAAIKAAGSLNAAHFLQLTAAMPMRPSMTPKPATPGVAARRRTRAAAFVASLDPSEQITAEEAGNFWISFDSACRQGSRTDAFWLLQAAQHPLSVDAIWSAIRIACRGPTHAAITLLHKAAGTNPMWYQAEFGKNSDMTACIVNDTWYQAAATLILCTPTAEHDAMLRPPRLPLAPCDWDCHLGRRAARIHAIPKEALHAGTTRGKIPTKYTNIGDVRDPIALLPEGCRFWQEALRSYGIVADVEAGTMEFPDDTVLDRFYDRYFPDDIPDEWSAADQAKSHGRGCQETAAVAPRPLVREEPVTQRAWNCGIRVRWP